MMRCHRDEVQQQLYFDFALTRNLPGVCQTVLGKGILTDVRDCDAY